jgi:hypothetical protein
MNNEWEPGSFQKLTKFISNYTKGQAKAEKYLTWLSFTRSIHE